jgi:hypothetical protein
MTQTAQAFVQAESTTGDQQKKPSVDAVADSIKSVEAQLRPLPIGWNFGSSDASVTFWLAKLAGLAITAVALSLGAPFWFDLLSKFMKIRGTGDKPQRTS